MLSALARTRGRSMISSPVTTRRALHKRHGAERNYTVVGTGLTGGRVGPLVKEKLEKAGVQVVATTSRPGNGKAIHVDPRNYEQARSAIFSVSPPPKVIVHSAAVSTGTFDKQAEVNVQGTVNMVRIANELRVPLVYVSTAAAKTPGLETLGNNDAAYAKSKALASEKVQSESDDFTTLYANILLAPNGGESKVKFGDTPDVTVLAGLRGVFRFALKKDRLIQPTTYGAMASAMAKIVEIAATVDPAERDRRRSLDVAGDQVSLNSFIKEMNPNAPIVVELDELSQAKEFLAAYNDGVITSEFAALSELPEGATVSNEEFKALVGPDEFPSVDAVCEAARKEQSTSQLIGIAKKTLVTCFSQGTVSMFKGIARAALAARVRVEMPPLMMPTRS